MKTVAETLAPENSREVKTEDRYCEKHGKYEARKHFFMSGFSVCNNCALEEQAKRDAEAALAAEERKKRKWQNRLNEAAIPERFMSKKLGSYVAATDEQKMALAFAVDYSKNFSEQAFKTGQCAVFCGRPGTGKTHLAVGIALNIMYNHASMTVAFTTVQRVMRRVKGTWSRNSDESESDAMAAYQDADLLILDEVGVQFGSDTEKQILFDLFNTRYERRLPTIFISNLQLKDQMAAGKTVQGLEGYLGERVYDRIKEDGGKVVPFTWDSHRGK